ncbi:MAG: DNA polymerase III subunit gamma/tau [Anaerolineae bacterium]|jgi:DNA polymerase-3 subunit gamma/tau
MAAQAIYRKWRPQTFEEIVGQEHVVRTLRNALLSGRVHHAYLFAGPRGTGKTTTARLLAKAVNCLAPEEQRPCNECEICVAINEGRLIDLIEIDAASNTGVDDVRELRERIGFRPNEARYKVYVIDEVHMLSNAAFNALLKTLEEPPEHAIFVAATTEPRKIPPTVLSRCQRFDFHRISVSQMVERLAWLAEQEGIEAEHQALELMARQATGSMRDAESLLDQLASYDEGGITVNEMQAALGIGADETVTEISQALLEGDVAKGLEAINSAVDRGADPRQFARQMVEHLRALLLLRLESGVVPPHIPEALLPSLRDQADAFSRRQLVRAVRLFNEASQETRGGWQPQLPLEMAFIEAVLHTGPPVDPDEGKGSSAGRAGANQDRTRARSRREGSGRGVEASEAATSGTSGGRRGATGTGSRREGDRDSKQSTQANSVREPPPTFQVSDSVDGPLSVQTVRDHWPDFLNALRPKDLKLEALMRSCDPVAVEDDVVVLSFSHKFHRTKVEEEKKRNLVEDVLSDLFGRQLRVRCVIDRRGIFRQAQEAEEPDEDANDSPGAGVSVDPLVRMAVDELGAEVVSGSV